MASLFLLCTGTLLGGMTLLALQRLRHWRQERQWEWDPY
jgi:hypothetical protein